jgi:hypothetical protein
MFATLIIAAYASIAFTNDSIRMPKLQEAVIPISLVWIIVYPLEQALRLPELFRT